MSGLYHIRLEVRGSSIKAIICPQKTNFQREGRLEISMLAHTCGLMLHNTDTDLLQSQADLMEIDLLKVIGIHRGVI